jgi:hypothetical protein
MVKNDISDGAMVWYVLLNLVTLGAPYFLKIIIMKAIVDSHHSQVQTVSAVVPVVTQ